jgi:hypothetical protein
MTRLRGSIPTAWGAAALVTLLIVAPAGASSHRRTPPPVPTHKLVVQGPITFWECPSKTTKVLIAVSSLKLHPGDQLKLNFIVRNAAAKPCGYVVPVAGSGGATAATLGMGPCGAVGFEILGAHNRMVWPGVKPFNCPALTFAQLGTNAAVVGSGSWDQSNQSGTGRVAAGHYVLMVDDHYAFALTLLKN